MVVSSEKPKGEWEDQKNQERWGPEKKKKNQSVFLKAPHLGLSPSNNHFEHFKGENTEQKSFFVKQTSQLM